MKYKKGDRIIITEKCSITGWTGTVIEHKILEFHEEVHINWDKSESGWMPPSSMKLLQTDWDS